jgi:UDP-N-acetylmuramoylalanine--D-glutamate ligase
VKHSPHIAVVQAITPEHLDYYLNFEEYINAKASIAEYQTEQDTVYYNGDSETAEMVAELSRGKQVKFKLKKSLVEPEKMLIPGLHNVLNATPAVLIAKQLGIKPKESLRKVYSFAGLPHRLQLVAEQNSVRFYNDSLSTTPEAAMAAVESFDGPVVLIAGGYDRGLGYIELGAFLAKAALGNKLHGLIYFSPSGERIVDAIAMYDPTLILPMIEVETMAEAVAEAKALAEPGDTVLMSPASASFGRFKDYADRGEQFVKAVNAH